MLIDTGRTAIARSLRVARGGPAFVLSVLALGACETIAGYDGRVALPSLAPDAGRRSSDADVAGADAEAVTPDADEELVSTTPNCVALGASCPVSKPHCAIYFEPTVDKHTYTCVSDDDDSAAPGLDVTCGSSPAKCADGLACGYSWRSGYQCKKICATKADCPATHPFCNHSLLFVSGLAPQNLCEACDPTKSSDCAGTNDVCLARSVATEPTCGVSATTGGALGAACVRASACQRGLMCVCKGAQALGDDCVGTTDGVCRKPCAPFERNAACAGANGHPSPGTCVGVGAVALYSYCKP